MTASPRARVRLLLAAFLTLIGCITVDATLRSDGSGTLEMTYRTPPDATEFLEKQRYSSPHVTVERVKIYEDQTTVLRATVDDVTRLSTAEGFRTVTVTREPTGDDERVTIRLTSPGLIQVKPERAPWITIRVTFPGPVSGVDCHGAISGNQVTWTISQSAFLSRAATVLSATYTPSHIPNAGLGPQGVVMGGRRNVRSCLEGAFRAARRIGMVCWCWTVGDRYSTGSASR